MKFLVSILVIVSLTGCSTKVGNIFKTMKPKADIEDKIVQPIYDCNYLYFIRACSEKIEGFNNEECGMYWGYDMTELEEILDEKKSI